MAWFSWLVAASRLAPLRPTPQAKGKFEDLGFAYETLTDPDMRKRYDRGGVCICLLSLWHAGTRWHTHAHTA